MSSATLTTQINNLTTKLANEPCVTESCVTDLQGIFNTAKAHKEELSNENKTALANLTKDVNAKMQGSNKTTIKSVEQIIGTAKNELPFLKKIDQFANAKIRSGTPPLSLTNNNIKDLTPIKDLADLAKPNNNIKDLTPIKDLADLAKPNNNIKDLTPIKDLANLAKTQPDNNASTQSSNQSTESRNPQKNSGNDEQVKKT